MGFLSAVDHVLVMLPLSWSACIARGLSCTEGGEEMNRERISHAPLNSCSDLTLPQLLHRLSVTGAVAAGTMTEPSW